MVVADSNIFISVFRGNKMAESAIRKYYARIAVSIITVMELRIGATNPSKRALIDELLSPYEIIPLNKQVGIVALRLIESHTSPQRRLSLGDALIAATCIVHNADLLTFNRADFNFISGIRLVG